MSKDLEFAVNLTAMEIGFLYGMLKREHAFHPMSLHLSLHLQDKLFNALGCPDKREVFDLILARELELIEELG